MESILGPNWLKTLKIVPTATQSDARDQEYDLGKSFGPTGATNLGLTDKGCAIKGLVVCNGFGLTRSTVLPYVVINRLPQGMIPKAYIEIL